MFRLKVPHFDLLLQARDGAQDEKLKFDNSAYDCYTPPDYFYISSLIKQKKFSCFLLSQMTSILGTSSKRRI